MLRGWQSLVRWGGGLALAAALAACAAGSPRLDRPRGLAVAADGSLYAANAAKLLALHLSGDGRVEQTFSLGRPYAGQSTVVWDMALDAQGNLYFCIVRRDEVRTLHDGVEVYTAAGRFMREIGGQDYAPDSQIPPNLPYGLTVDSAGRVYVADYGTGALRVFDAQGQPLAQFFGAADVSRRFVGLNDVAVDEQRHLLYAVDSDGQQIVQFDLNTAPGGPLAITPRLTIGAYGSDPGQVAFPVSAVVDQRTGELYVADLANRRIQAFTAEGQYVRQFTPPAVDDWAAMGLALGPEGTLYAADTLNNALWAFTAEGRFLGRIEAH